MEFELITTKRSSVPLNWPAIELKGLLPCNEIQNEYKYDILQHVQESGHGEHEVLFASKQHLNHTNSNIRFNRTRICINIFERSSQGISPTCTSSYDQQTSRTLNVQSERSNTVLLDEVIELIRLKLKRNPFFSVHEVLRGQCFSSMSKSQTKASEGEASVDDNSTIKEIKVEDSKNTTNSQLVISDLQLNEEALTKMATSDPQTSYTLQRAIQSQGKGIDDLAKNVTVGVITALMRHKYGSYVLQEILKLSEEARSLATTYCMQQFEVLYDDGFASRIMQLLSTYSKEFRLFLFNWMSHNLERTVKSSPAVFLFANGMRSTGSEEESRILNGIFLHERQSSEILTHRYFKRLLVAYLENAPLETVDQYVQLNRIDKKVKQLMNDKFGGLILYIVIKKGQLLIRKKLLQLISTDLIGLFQRKFFKFFFFKTAKYARENNEELQFQLAEALRCTALGGLRMILANEHSKQFFIFLLILTVSTSNINFQQFLSEVQHHLTYKIKIPHRLFNILQIYPLEI